MKIRNGFVSNSSSSSFIVMQKAENLSRKEMIKKTKEALLKYCDYDEEDLNDRANKVVDKGNIILFITSVEYGAEDTAEKIIARLCEIFGIKGVSCEQEN